MHGFQPGQRRIGGIQPPQSATGDAEISSLGQGDTEISLNGHGWAGHPSTYQGPEFQLTGRIGEKLAPKAVVADADARYACVRLLPVAAGVMAQVVIDAANGALLGMSLPNRVRVMGIGGGGAIGKGNLKDFAQAASGR